MPKCLLTEVLNFEFRILRSGTSPFPNVPFAEKVDQQDVFGDLEKQWLRRLGCFQGKAHKKLAWG